MHDNIGKVSGIGPRGSDDRIPSRFLPPGWTLVATERPALVCNPLFRPQAQRLLTIALRDSIASNSLPITHDCSALLRSKPARPTYGARYWHRLYRRCVGVTIVPRRWDTHQQSMIYAL